MMDLSTIRNMADKAARKAARDKCVPYVIHDEAEGERSTTFPFPFMGDYCPRGWTLVETLFCDSSGMGGEDEAALSVRQLRTKLLERVKADETYGFAITEAGQFQVYLGVYLKK